MKRRSIAPLFLLMAFAALTLTACASVNALAVAEQWVAENEAAVGAGIAGVVRTQAINQGVPELVAQKFSDEMVTEQIRDSIEWTYSEPRTHPNGDDAIVTANGTVHIEAFGLTATATMPIDIVVDMTEGLVRDYEFRILEATFAAEFDGQSIEVDRESVEEAAGEAIKGLLGK